MRSPGSTPYDGQDWRDSLFAAASAGWLWSDNLKTELDFGAGTRARSYRSELVVIDGRPSYRVSDRRFSRRTFGISQQYQFFHNVWFHPHVAVGVNLTSERFTERTQPIYVYDDVTRTSRYVGGLEIDGPKSETTVRPFVATGFKAYMSPRAFFRGDMRVAFRGGVDEVLMRLGFGVDF